MKISTGDFKNSDYNEDHILYVGTHIGAFKKIDLTDENPFIHVNLQSIKNLEKDSKITCLNWGNDAQTEILVGRTNNFVKIYDVENNENVSNVEFLEGPIVGLTRYDRILVAGIQSGKIQILQDSPEPIIIETGDNLCHIRQNKWNKKQIASGGKGLKNRLKIWDVSTRQNIFTSKNVPNDSLQLEVPVWESDFDFMDSNCVATCSRYGYIRYYDIRKQKRPVLRFESKEQIAFTCLAVHDNYIYVGSNMGHLRAYDARHLKHNVHTYKGFTGSITDIGIDSTGKYLYSTCLDRYARIHDAAKSGCLYQTYVKSKGTQILLKELQSLLNKTLDSDCHIVDTSLMESDEGSENEEEKPVAKTDKDEEYDTLFAGMEKINDQENDAEQDNGDEPPKKKKKNVVRNKLWKKKKINKKI